MGENDRKLLYHFLLPFNMKYFLSSDLTAVIAIFATSEPASGSVMAMHILFFPRMISGTKRFCSSGLPNFIMGGNPKAKPIVMAPLGPLVPIRAICEDISISSAERDSSHQFHPLHLYKSTYVSNQTLPLLILRANALCRLLSVDLQEVAGRNLEQETQQKQICGISHLPELE
jgi:hypothetical protein